MSLQPVLIDGRWETPAKIPEGGTVVVQRHLSPHDRSPSAEAYPVSTWGDVERALHAARNAFRLLRAVPAERRAEFLERLADRLEARAAELVATAHRETALAVEPRLAKVELPRTTDQLRQAARAARSRAWALPTIDRKNNLRSMLAPLGPVAVFGPNNFPFAFNGAAGGDFAAAIAVGCPVIAKSNPGHPATSKLLAEEALEALRDTGLPPATVQLLYRIDHQVGLRLAAHPLLGAVAFTGAKGPGLALKAAADAVGKPIYLELGSNNPVVVLPGALRERGPALAAEFAGSCLMGTGQFCTNGGLVLLLAGPATEAFLAGVAEAYRAAPNGPLLSDRGLAGLNAAVDRLRLFGAHAVCGGRDAAGKGFHYENTLLRASARQFLDQPAELQTEAFGNATLAVVAASAEELDAVLGTLHGNLTGCLYSAADGSDDAAYDLLAPTLRERVGRLLNDKMPTGVAVSPAMQHGGPFPASGHPGFTAVGMPAALRRFGALQAWDNVRPGRLPPELRDANLTPPILRLVDGEWTAQSLA